MTKPVIFFFRGLNTYGDDRARFGPLDFGPVSEGLKKYFAQAGVEFVFVTGMGSGPLTEIAERARVFVRGHTLWLNHAGPTVFLGHSAGGLIARKLFGEPEFCSASGSFGQSLKCITVATPHRGSKLAEILCRAPSAFPKTARLLEHANYDLKRRHQFFLELTPAAVSAFFIDSISAGTDLEAQNSGATRALYSVVCSAPRAEWCWPLRAMHCLTMLREFSDESDGIVERSSQAAGTVLAEIRIDHFRQVGLPGGKHPQFIELCRVLLNACFS